MAQEALIGHSTRDLVEEVYETTTSAIRSFKKSIPPIPLTEAGRVSATFGYRLDQRTSAYTSGLNDVGIPGSTVDCWRVHLTGR